jgi:hypothetical protein
MTPLDYLPPASWKLLLKKRAPLLLADANTKASKMIFPKRKRDPRKLENESLCPTTCCGPFGIPNSILASNMLGLQASQNVTLL